MKLFSVRRKTDKCLDVLQDTSDNFGWTFTFIIRPAIPQTKSTVHLCNHWLQAPVTHIYPPNLHNLISVQPPCSTRYSSLVTLARPPTFVPFDMPHIVCGRLPSTVRSCHAHSLPPFRPRLPCSHVAKSRPQPGCLAVTSSPPDSGLTR